MLEAQIYIKKYYKPLKNRKNLGGCCCSTGGGVFTPNHRGDSECQIITAHCSPVFGLSVKVFVIGMRNEVPQLLNRWCGTVCYQTPVLQPHFKRAPGCVARRSLATLEDQGSIPGVDSNNVLVRVKDISMCRLICAAIGDPARL